MAEKEHAPTLAEQLERLKRIAPEVYRHIVGLIREAANKITP